MHKDKSVWVLLGMCAAMMALFTSPLPAKAARSLEECQLAWGTAVRSFAPANVKGLEDEQFKDACQATGNGDKPKGRIDAMVVAAKGLAKADTESCKRFMKFYAGASSPQKVCDAAKSDDENELRKVLAETLPKPKSK